MRRLLDVVVANAGEVVLAVALLALALYVPWTLYPPSDASHAVFRIAVCLAAAGGIAIPRGRLVRWGLGLWAVGITTSVILALDPWRALWSTHNRNEGAWQAAHCLLLVLVAAATPRERLVRWLAVAATLAAAWGLTSWGWVGGRLVGSTGNPLYLAPLLLLGVWAAHRAGWTLLMPVLALGAALTMSKGVIVAVVASCSFLVSRYSVPILGLRVPVLGVLGPIVAVGLWFIPLGGSALIRLELGRVAAHGIAAAPWGWGAEGYPLVWDTFWRGVSATGEAWHDRAHSLVMDRAIEWGIHGLIGWGIVVYTAYTRAELPERVALIAYLVYSLTMFEMMWGAAGFAVLLGYTLRGRPCRVNRPMAWTAAAVALVVGAAQLNQSWLGAHAATKPEMRRAVETWSPIGGDLIETYLRVPQTAEDLEWADDHVEFWAPHRTQQLFVMAIWDRAWCLDLKLVAPNRPDVRWLCSR